MPFYNNKKNTFNSSPILQEHVQRFIYRIRDIINNNAYDWRNVAYSFCACASGRKPLIRKI